MCRSPRWKASVASQPNLYSERLAQLLGWSEHDLLEACENRICVDCGLIYKGCWPSAEIIDRLFADEIAVHPKGWDAVSGCFSAQGFASTLAEFEHSLANAETNVAARCRRTLASLIDSLVEWAELPRRAQLLAAIAADDLAVLRDALPELADLEWSPWPFKRFSGFAVPELWRWYESELGPVRNYAETGCPLWGFLCGRPEAHVELQYWNREWPNYWGESCHKAGIGCRQAIAADGRVQVSGWNAHAANRVDLVGAYQFLDHLEDPLSFVRDALARSRALSLILDSGTGPPSVQHLSGWSLAAIHALATRAGARVVHGFAPILASGNDVYLLVNDDVDA